jgi:hypothetical protein
VLPIKLTPLPFLWAKRGGKMARNKIPEQLGRDGGNCATGAAAGRGAAHELGGKGKCKHKAERF